MSPPPGIDEIIVSTWNEDAYVVDNGRFEVLTTTNLPIFDFDRYGGFRRCDIVSDIQKAWKVHQVPFTARLYYTANGVRMILPSKSFADQPDMLQFTRQIPHMDQLYLKYTMRTKLYRARLTVKPARIPKEPIVPLFERTGVCPSNKFAVTTYIGTLQPRTGECIDKHQYDYALYREKLTFLSIRDMTNVAQTNALVPAIFNIQTSMLPHSLPTILEYDVDSHAAIDHLIKRSTIMMHDIITGAYLRSFKLL